MTGKKIEKDIYLYDEEKNKDYGAFRSKKSEKKNNFKNINFKLLAGKLLE